MDKKQPEVFEFNSLKITKQEIENSIEVKWEGKSIDREPSSFISPILLEILERSSEKNKSINMDFTSLKYMNSSTITPIIKILERAKRSNNRLTLVYDKSLKWQELSFTALEIFQTPDQRIKIQGLG